MVVRDCRGAGPYLLTPHQARHYHLAVRGGENPRAPLCPTAIGRRVQTEDEVLAWSYGFGLQQAPEFVRLKEQIEALSPASGQAASTTVNDHARERQHLEEQLKAVLAAPDH